MKICRQEAEKKGIVLDDEYLSRLEREVKVIEDGGFADYFFILKGIVDSCKEKRILTGWSRGSAGGSLVSYLLGITKIDPLKYGLIFERFLDPSRKELPDIDLDVQMSRRGEVVQDIEDTYGEESVSHIVNFVRFKPRNTIKDICRVYNYPFTEINFLTSKIPESVKTIDEAVKITEVRTFFNKHPEIEKACRAFEGSIRGLSKHAAGILITPGALSDYVSTVKVKGEICSCFNKAEVENLGLLKADILGLRTLDIIARTLELAGLTEEDLPDEFDDPKVFELFQEGDSLGLFQFETNLLTGMTKKVRPTDFETLCILTAAARPGGLNSGSTERYIKKRLGTLETSYLHPDLKQYLESTLGEIFFQEDIMKIGNEIGGIELTRAYRMIKEISKSKGVEAINKYREEFVFGAQKNGWKEQTAHQMFDVIQEAGGYLFNLSHAVGYSALSYLTAWLKIYYSKEFLVALIEFPKPQKKEKAQTINRAVRELRNLGHKVKTPDINESGDKITIGSDGVVYMGLSDIAGVGTKAVEEIIQQRPYTSFGDFVGKVQKRKVNIRVLKNLVQAGVFDAFERRDKLYFSLVDEPFEEWDGEEMHKRELTVLDMPTEVPLIDYVENPYEDKVLMTALSDINFNEREDEIFVKGVISDVTIHKTSKVQLKEYYGDVQDMAIFDLDDGTYKVSCSVSPQTLCSYSKEINDGESVFIKGHTFGMGEKLHVDGVLSLTNPSDELTPFKKYIEKDKREHEAKKICVEGYNTNVVSQVSYHTSKKGKDYARVTFTNRETWLCFQLAREPIKVGEILIWKSQNKPFFNIRQRIP